MTGVQTCALPICFPVTIGCQKSANRFSDTGNRWLYLPCGKCIGCVKSRARDWAIRCCLELQYHNVACWATLTYADEYVPPTLRKDHLSGFMRKLRKLSGQKVRFFASGEYGETFGRPHYHPILYGIKDESLIRQAWPYGFAVMHDLRMEGIAYVAGYVQKKFVFDEEKEERIDYTTGESYVYQPPFRLMSRKPGIGGNAAGEFAASWRNTAMYHYRHVRVPRYLHEAWKKSVEWRDVMQKAIETFEYGKEHPIDWDRLQAGEQIAHSAHNIQSMARRFA